MSFLAHHCSCGHARYVHLGSRDDGFETPVGGSGPQKSCVCCSTLGRQKNMRDFDTEPTLHATRDFLTGETSPLVHPGGTWNAGTAHRMKTCACINCEAKYAELVA